MLPMPVSLVIMVRFGARSASQSGLYYSEEESTCTTSAVGARLVTRPKGNDLHTPGVDSPS